jgi:hypothetical protein
VFHRNACHSKQGTRGGQRRRPRRRGNKAGEALERRAGEVFAGRLAFAVNGSHETATSQQVVAYATGFGATRMQTHGTRTDS